MASLYNGGKTIIGSIIERTHVEATLFGEFKVQLTSQSIQTWNNARGHDPDLLNFFFKRLIGISNPIVLDIGAHTGMFSLMTCFHPKSLFYSFEPAPETFRMLNENLELNHVKNQVQTFNLALADYVGAGELKIPPDPGSYGLSVLGTPLRFKNYTTVKVQVDTLDHFAMEHNLTSANLIKIDTEGCELFVLKGGEQFIHECLPDILTEHYLPNTLQFGYSNDEITKLLSSWGYTGKRVGSEDVFFTHPERK